MNIRKLKRKIKNRDEHVLRKTICEIMDSDWEELSDHIKIGIAMLLITYREKMTGIKEASNYIPYLESAEIEFNGKTLKDCLDTISKYNLINKDGSLNIDTESDTSGIAWIMVGLVFDGKVEICKKDGQVAYRSTKKGLEAAEKILKDLKGK